MSWIAVAVGAGTALVGGVQANQERQRKKGVIGKAFGIARERQALRQKDVAQGAAESLVQRGLAGGGGALPAGPRTAIRKGAPTATMRARTLGEQLTADNEREFALERRDLDAQEDMARAGVNAQANSAMISAAVNGVNTAVGLKGSMAPGASTPAAASSGNGVMVDTPPPGGNKYPGSFAGVDPVDPLGRGAWKSAATTGGFNVFNEGAS